MVNGFKWFDCCLTPAMAPGAMLHSGGMLEGRDVTKRAGKLNLEDGGQNHYLTRMLIQMPFVFLDPNSFNL